MGFDISILCNDATDAFYNNIDQKELLSSEAKSLTNVRNLEMLCRSNPVNYYVYFM